MQVCIEKMDYSNVMNIYYQHYGIEENNMRKRIYAAEKLKKMSLHCHLTSDDDLSWIENQRELFWFYKDIVKEIFNDRYHKKSVSGTRFGIARTMKISLKFVVYNDIQYDNLRNVYSIII